MNTTSMEDHESFNRMRQLEFELTAHERAYGLAKRSKKIAEAARARRAMTATADKLRALREAGSSGR